jgi:hypothetical protein
MLTHDASQLVLCKVRSYNRQALLPFGAQILELSPSLEHLWLVSSGPQGDTNFPIFLNHYGQLQEYCVVY